MVQTCSQVNLLPCYGCREQVSDRLCIGSVAVVKPSINRWFMLNCSNYYYCSFISKEISLTISLIISGER